MHLFLLTTFFILTLGLLNQHARAQTFDEWWHQKKTRIQYLEQQVAALQAFKNAVEEGYMAVEEGIHSVTDIDEEEHDLHVTYFNKMITVHPVVRYSPEVSGILAFHKEALDVIFSSEDSWLDNPWLLPQDHLEIQEIFHGIRNQLIKERRLLMRLTNDGQLTMLDGERLEALQLIGGDAVRIVKYVAWYIEVVNSAIRRREQQSDDLNNLKNIFP